MMNCEEISANTLLLQQALGRVSSGVYVVTLRHKNEQQGMLATWIMQASFEPPMLSLAVKTERQILPQLGEGKCFSVNVLSKKNLDIFKAFARPYQPELDRFAELELSAKGTAGPVFTDTLAYLDCVVRGQIAAGDHIIITAEITGGEVLNSGEPMLHTRTIGTRY